MVVMKVWREVVEVESAGGGGGSGGSGDVASDYAQWSSLSHTHSPLVPICWLHLCGTL